MMISKSRETKEKVRGIKDKFGFQERDSKEIGREIFRKNGYEPRKLLIDNNQVISPSSQFNGLEFGIDDIIYYEDISKEDKLDIKRIKPLNCSNPFVKSFYSIDYKSNNFINDYLYDLRSVYVKLMRFGNRRLYTDEKRSEFLKRDKEAYLKVLSDGGMLNESSMRKVYLNKYILGEKNYTDYLVYLKYNKVDYSLNHSYIVSAEILRHQVICILNEILKKKSSNSLIELRKDDFYLNIKLKKAYQIYKSNRDSYQDYEMFVSRGGLILRIPEDILNGYIKIDQKGKIIKKVTSI